MPARLNLEAPGLKDYLDKRGCAAHLGIEVGTLDKMRTAGKGPPETRKLGRVMFYKPAVDAWLRGEIETDAELFTA
jgi:hypothetical protein